MDGVRRKVPRVATVVAGGGPSTSSLLANVLRPRNGRKPAECDINVVRLQPGESMWGQFPGDFAMGQSAGTLTAPGHQGKGPQDRFMKVADFNAYTQKRDRESLAAMEATEVRGEVARIRKNADFDFQVIYVDRTSGATRELQARQVYFSPGPRAERSILGDVGRNRRNGKDRAFPEYPGAVEILTNQVKVGRGGVVAVIGDGPTAIWAAQMIADQGNRVVILGPDTPSAFGQSNPGGRNSGILRAMSDSIYIGSVIGIEEREVSNRAEWSEPGTVLVVRNFRRHDFKSRGRTVHLPVSAVVSAIGSAVDVCPAIDGGLLNALSVVPGAAALATERGDFVLFGASAYYHAKSLKQAVSFDEAGRTINQPPVGIATLEMSARTLSRSMRDGWALEQALCLADLHPVSATASEIAGAFETAGVDRTGAAEMAAQVVAARSKSTGEWTNRTLAEAMGTLMDGGSLGRA